MSRGLGTGPPHRRGYRGGLRSLAFLTTILAAGLAPITSVLLADACPRPCTLALMHVMSGLPMSCDRKLISSLICGAGSHTCTRGPLVP